MSNTSTATIALVALSGIAQSVTSVMSKAGKPYLKGSILCGEVTQTVVALGEADMAAIMGRMIPGQPIALVGGHEKGDTSKSFIAVGLAQGGETQTAAPAPVASNDNQAQPQERVLNRLYSLSGTLKGIEFKTCSNERATSYVRAKLTTAPASGKPGRTHTVMAFGLAFEKFGPQFVENGSVTLPGYFRPGTTGGQAFMVVGKPAQGTAATAQAA